MAEIWQIFNTEEADLGNEPAWYVDQIRLDDGHTVRLVIPKCVIEWRAVEYGMDATTPEGRQAILDLAIHEPHIPAIDPMTISRNARGNRRPDDEVHLYNAPTRAHAREVHLAKLEETKANRVNIQWPTGAKKRGLTQSTEPHPLLQNLLAHEPDPIGVEQKEQVISQVRQSLGLEDRPPAKPEVVPPYDQAMRRRSITIAIMDRNGVTAQ